MELVDSLMESEFLGFGTAYRHEDRRVVYLKALPERYSVLVEQLNIWEKEGLLSFVEEAR